MTYIINIYLKITSSPKANNDYFTVILATVKYLQCHKCGSKSMCEMWIHENCCACQVIALLLMDDKNNNRLHIIYYGLASVNRKRHKHIEIMHVDEP